MDGELDIAGAASAGGFIAWRNCGSVLRGPWCDWCGQLGEDFHRSARRLAGEAFEGFFHADCMPAP